MNMTNWKIGVRLGLGFGVILALLAGVAMLGINGMSRSNHALKHIVNLNVNKMALLEDMAESVHIAARVMRTIALLRDKTAAQHEHGKIDQARQQ